jgi:hypothetical protein
MIHDVLKAIADRLKEKGVKCSLYKPIKCGKRRDSSGRSNKFYGKMFSAIEFRSSVVRLNVLAVDGTLLLSGKRYPGHAHVELDLHHPDKLKEAVEHIIEMAEHAAKLEAMIAR